MTQLDKYNLVELLGLESIPQESLNQIVSKTIEVIYRRVFNKVDAQGLISQEAKSKVIQMEEASVNMEEIQQFISEQIPTFTDMIIAETDLMKIEMLQDQIEKLLPSVQDSADIQFLNQVKEQLRKGESIEEVFEKYKDIRVKYKFV